MGNYRFISLKKERSCGEKILFAPPTSQSSTTKSIRIKRRINSVKTRTFSVETAIGTKFTVTTSRRGCLMSSGLFGAGVEISLLWRFGKTQLGLLLGLH